MGRQLKDTSFKDLFLNSPEGLFLINPETSIIMECNHAAGKVVGLPREEIIGIHQEKLKDMLPDKEMEVSSSPVSLGGEELLFLIVRELPVGVRKLKNERNNLETTLMSVTDGVISCNRDGKIIFINRMAESLTGWQEENALGRDVEEVYHVVHDPTREKREDLVKKVIQERNVWEFSNHAILISKDGIERAIEDSASLLLDEENTIQGAVVVFRDYTEKRNKMDQVEFLSYHDKLTGLYNRRFFEEEMNRLDTERNLPFSLIMGDVNGLKLMNDSFGHVLGDELLQKVADVLREGCRNDEIIARIGGDEFVILLPKTDADQADHIVRRIKDLCTRQRVNALEVSISFGAETKREAEEDLQEILKKAEMKMYQEKLVEGPRVREKTINTIIHVFNNKNKNQGMHVERVSELCETLGSALGLTEHKLELLRKAGLLHDIGKVALDDYIFVKPEALDEEEREQVNRHTEIGYRILSTVKELSEMADYVLYHHEKWDGKGYPYGLKGEKIPLESRILAIVDAYEAMTSERSYRKPMEEEKALQELEKNAGGQFDPNLVCVFIKKMKEGK